MATYNGEKYIKEQLHSIIKQLEEDDEIIVSDDCSFDKTVEIIKDFNDSRIKIHVNEKNIGFIKNFEKALNFAKNDWILLSDQDDIWLEHKLSLLRGIINYKDNIGAIFSNHFILHKNKKICKKTYYDDLFIKIFLPYLNTFAHGPGIAFNRKLIKKILPFPTYIASHDQWIGQLLSLITKTYINKIPTQIYRKHEEQFTHEIKRPLKKKISSRIYMLKNLIRRKFF